jgi:hypothetical protein
LRRDQAWGEQEVNIQLDPVSLVALWQPGKRIEPTPEMRDRLHVRRPRGRISARLQPEADRLILLPRLGVMVGQDLRLSLDRFGKLLLQGARDRPVQLGALRPQQAAIGGVSHQRVLESVDGPRRLAPAEEQLRVDELAKSLVQPLAVLSRDCAQDLEGKFASDRSADLRNFPRSG